MPRNVNRLSLIGLITAAAVLFSLISYAAENHSAKIDDQSTINQQTEEIRMSKLSNTININGSAEEVWAIVGDPNDVSWIPGIVKAQVKGNTRICATADGHEIKEEINYLDAEHRFNYKQLKSPMPIKNSAGIFEVRQQGNGSVVVWDAEFEVLDAAQKDRITAMIDGYYKQTLEGVRSLVEGGLE